jgi:hypothetical protein
MSDSTPTDPDAEPRVAENEADSTGARSGPAPDAGGSPVPRVAVETDVPPDATVYRCAYCDRPFATESYLILHRGLAHADRVSDEERAAFGAAYEREQSDLGRFRLVALGLLVLLYFGFLFVFAFVT